MTIRLHTEPLGWSFEFDGKRCAYRTTSKYQTKGRVRQDALNYLRELSDLKGEEMPQATFINHKGWEGLWPLENNICT